MDTRTLQRLQFHFITVGLMISVTMSVAFLYSCKDEEVPPSTQSTFKVKGRFLTDPCGDTIILRGVNKMSVFDEEDPEGIEYFPEIAKTGANSVRIVWQTIYSNGTATNLRQLEALIKNCIKEQMIPVIEMHDATCDLSRLDMVLDYWTRPDVVALVKKYEHVLLVNIANEAGQYEITADEFLVAYKDAITRLRNAGFRSPLIIDPPDCGKNLELVVPITDDLINHDPDHNLMISLHTYWPKHAGATPEFIKAQLQSAVDNNVPLVLGEVAAYGAWPGEGVHEKEGCGPQGEVNFSAFLTESLAQDIGWFLWEWGPGNAFYEEDNDDEDEAPQVYPCPQLDITTDGTYASVTNIEADDPNAWAKAAIITSEYSLKNAANKSEYLLNNFQCQ